MDFEPTLTRPFWQSLNETEQRALKASAEHATLPTGSVLCREGETAARVIVILAGWTKVCLRRGSGERIIALRGPGDLVGERAALLVRSRSATVVTLDAVEALVIPAAAFATFLDDHERALALLERQLYGRLTEERGGPSIAGDTERRIAEHIAAIAGPHADTGGRLTLPISHAELAAWVDAPQTEVEEVLSAWERNGYTRSLPYSLTVLDLPALTRTGTGAGTGVEHHDWAGQNCSILFTDVAGFSDHGRDDRDREAVRHAMYDALRGSFAAAELPWDSCHREDRGDGALIVVPPSTPTSALVGSLLPQLVVRLDAYNQKARAEVRIQLRTALEVGPVVPDREGVSGQAVIQAARLLDAPDFKAELLATGADLGVIVSQFVHDRVVRHTRNAVEPASYRPVEVRVKETATTAWMAFYHGARPLLLKQREPADTTDRGQSPAPIFGAAVDVQGDLVMGNKIKYIR